jgi:uncharacterized cupredoxin-like copper-binding protein
MALHPFLRSVAVAGAVVLTAVACGGDDDDETSAGADDVPSRVVEVEMTDQLKFEPESLTVSGGETIKFVFKNTGKLVHDALIGDAHIQQEHDLGMGAGAGHDSHHGGEEPPYVEVAAGGTKELVHKFTTPGEILIGCHQVGHWAAGMKIAVSVS